MQMHQGCQQIASTVRASPLFTWLAHAARPVDEKMESPGPGTPKELLPRPNSLAVDNPAAKARVQELFSSQTEKAPVSRSTEPKANGAAVGPASTRSEVGLWHEPHFAAPGNLDRDGQRGCFCRKLRLIRAQPHQTRLRKANRHWQHSQVPLHLRLSQTSIIEWMYTDWPAFTCTGAKAAPAKLSKQRGCFCFSPAATKD